MISSVGTGPRQVVLGRWRQARCPLIAVWMQIHGRCAHLAIGRFYDPRQNRASTAAVSR